MQHLHPEAKWNLTTNSTTLGGKRSADGTLVSPFIILPTKSMLKINQMISPWTQRTPDLEGQAGHLVAHSQCCWSPGPVTRALLIDKSSSEIALGERLVTKDKCLSDVTWTPWPAYLVLFMFFPLNLVRHLWLPRFSDCNLGFNTISVPSKPFSPYFISILNKNKLYVKYIIKSAGTSIICSPNHRLCYK